MEHIHYDHILVRYGELSTKGKNRKDFIRRLTNNIRAALASMRESGLYPEHLWRK